MNYGKFIRVLKSKPRTSCAQIRRLTATAATIIRVPFPSRRPRARRALRVVLRSETQRFGSRPTPVLLSILPETRAVRTSRAATTAPIDFRFDAPT